MWRTADEIQADVASGDPARMGEALETLAFHMDTMEPVTVPPIRAADLAVFGDELPDDVVDRWLKLLARFDGWDPPLSAEDAVAEAARAAARFGPSGLALEASLLAKTADDPGAMTRAALDAVGAEGGAVVTEHAGAFVSYLLAGDDTVRDATVDALAGWVARGELAAVVSWVEAELSDEERARVGV